MSNCPPTQTVPPRENPDLEASHSRLQQLLQRFGEQPLGHYIAGRWSPVPKDGDSFVVRAPADGMPLATVAAGTAADVDSAAQAAARSFHPWQRQDGQQRRQLLHRIAAGIVAAAEDLAILEAADTGQAIRYIQRSIRRGADSFRYFGDRAPEAMDGRATPTATHDNYTLRMPLGPAAIITPWNTPFMTSAGKIAAALAAGCTVVHKPAEWSPLTAALLADICTEAGLPAGVLNVVNGTGEDAGRPLSEHPAIRAVAFTGASATGVRIQRQTAATMKRLQLELGGKNPMLVFADADLERALDAAMLMAYSLNGERCTAVSRLLVQQDICEVFSERLGERVRRLRLGDPLDPETEIGPLIHPQHLERVCEYFAIAKAEGAEALVGGSRGEQGLYVRPTLYTGVHNGMRIAREEVFGPVLAVIPFADEAEALSLANDSEYGLAAYLWTGNSERAHRVARSLETGMVWINSDNVRNPTMPFGGIRASGIGRDGGDYSFDFYTETKNICIALGTHEIAALGCG